MIKAPLKDHHIYDVLEKALEKKSKLVFCLSGGVCKIFLYRENGNIRLKLLTKFEDKQFIFSKEKGVVGFIDKNPEKEKSFDARAAIDRSDALLYILSNHINDES